MPSRRFGNVWKGWSPSRKLAAVVLLVVLVVAGAAIASSNNDGSASARTADTSSAGGPKSAGAGGSGSGTSQEGKAGSDRGASSTPDTTLPPAPLPLKAEVKGTKGLTDGDEVTITVRADKDSQVFAVEMRLCRQGTVVSNDGDMLPTVTGQCASKPLSPGTDGFKVASGEPPFDQVTATYKVGTGTDTYKMDDGTENSVTCDASHPCVLAVKYQIPNGFGFRTYPLTFS
jgi:hypothetical protein